MAARWVAWSQRRRRAFPPEVFETEAEARDAYRAAAQALFEDADDSVYIGPRDASDCIAICIHDEPTTPRRRRA